MIFYRYHETEVFEQNIKVDLHEYAMLRETPQGYWIISKHYANYPKSMNSYLEKVKKWISKTSRKRYAYPTKGEAIRNFIRRKDKQKDHASYFFERAKIAKIKGEKILEELEK